MWLAVQSLASGGFILVTQQTQKWKLEAFGHRQGRGCCSYSRIWSSTINLGHKERIPRCFWYPAHRQRGGMRLGMVNYSTFFISLRWLFASKAALLSTSKEEKKINQGSFWRCFGLGSIPGVQEGRGMIRARDKGTARAGIRVREEPEGLWQLWDCHSMVLGLSFYSSGNCNCMVLGIVIP